MDQIREFLQRIYLALQWPIIQTAETTITVWSLVYLLVLIVFLLWLARLLQRWLVYGPLTRTKLDIGARQAWAHWYVTCSCSSACWPSCRRRAST